MMDNLLGKKIDRSKAILGTIILLIGVFGLFYGPPLISTFSLCITGFISFWIVFGVKGINNLFSKPVAPIRTILFYLILNILLSIGTSFLLLRVLHWNLHGNSAAESFQPILLIAIPIMILGEELLSLFFLSLFSSKFSVILSNIFSALIFALLHYSTYNNGNIFHTLVHIIIIQGVARILFNQSAIKSNSIITSWIVHVLFDFLALVLAFYIL